MAVCRSLACAAAVACRHTLVRIRPEMVELCATCSLWAMHCKCSFLAKGRLACLWECVWSLNNTSGIHSFTHLGIVVGSLRHSGSNGLCSRLCRGRCLRGCIRSSIARSCMGYLRLSGFIPAKFCMALIMVLICNPGLVAGAQQREHGEDLGHWCWQMLLPGQWLWQCRWPGQLLALARWRLHRPSPAFTGAFHCQIGI